MEMDAPRRRALVVLCCVCIERALSLFLSFSGFESIPTKNNVGAGRPCDREAIRNGLWLEKRVEEAEAEGGNGNYDWSVPTQGCSFQSRFHSGDFCRLMGNSVVLILGDSISFEQYASLVRLATNGTVISEKLKDRAFRKRGLPVIINSCGQKSNVTLLYRTSTKLTVDQYSISMDDILTQMPPTAVVLNTGSHYRGDNEFMSTFRPAVSSLEKWQQSCTSRNNITCPFFYRTTFPGIPQCMNFTEPENNRTKVEEYMATQNPGEEWNAYGWKEFKRQNGLALDSLASSKLQYEIIDGYEMGLTRPDTRKSASDCLHNRVPAIADAQNAAFLHHLKGILSEDDVAAMTKLNHGFDRRTNVNEEFSDMNWEMVDSPDYPYKYG